MPVDRLCSLGGMFGGIRGIALRRGALVGRAAVVLRFGESRSRGR